MRGAHRLLLLLMCIPLSLSETQTQKTEVCPRWGCPKNSDCVDKRSCRCKPGFISSGRNDNGLITNLLQSCEDVNECLLPGMSTICGSFATCQNSEGSYHCTCNLGYKLRSGETSFANKNENTCEVDTGVTPAPSGSHTVTAAPGSLPKQPATVHPRTQPGDPGEKTPQPATVHPWTQPGDPGEKTPQPATVHPRTQPGDPGEKTPQPATVHPRTQPGDPGEKTPKDVNECASGQNRCHPSTHCINKLGNYSCNCRHGWKPVLGSPNGPINTVCEDIDECSTGQHQCHNSTVCSNTQGSYKCRCHPGWKLISRLLSDPKSIRCQEPFPAWTLLPTAQSRSLSHFSVEVQNLLRDFDPATANYTIQKLIEAMDKLLEAPTDIDTLNATDRHLLATLLLKYMEQSLRMLAQFLPKGPFTYTSPSNTELSLMIKEQDNKDITTVYQSQAWMKLDWALTAGAERSENGYSLAGILSSPNMQKLLANASMDLTQSRDLLEELYESPVLNVSLTLLSNVSSIFLTNTDTGKLTSNVTFKFSHSSVESKRPREQLICAFWDTGDDGSGRWATDGCSLNDTGFCQCNHLSSFAILMAQYHVQDPRLELITKVGLSLSLICLLLCILTFLLVKPIQSSRTMVHLHLCICLFLGSLIFLVGVENEGGEVSPRCRLVAMLLHYLFLAAFCWMALEGVELYFLVVRVFQGQGLSVQWRCLIGYGVPLLIVAISAAAKLDGYGQQTYCWLNYKDGFLWSFVGPLAFIIFCNSAIFLITVWKLTAKFSEINPNMKKLRKARVLTITAIAQLIVLGSTWVFGLFLFDPHSRWLSYIFTLLNCLQGLFLFLMLCLLNKKVREEYRKWACMLAGNKYSEFSSSTAGTGTSQSQTRSLRASESGM
ncbi:adhesion G protein-coupled receptor E5 isoform X3 [Alexandromys fortis]|uniref:adhesion G protein-coupled receptor E5 isoform X3 n=1 Tax=Alexandromys fortis TaxID=100897 RepID=UPI002152DD16|nr:adhesion G protein-coupled receptor E5 isoform X3 [Microtus fortis]